METDARPRQGQDQRGVRVIIHMSACHAEPGADVGHKRQRVAISVSVIQAEKRDELRVVGE